jgi:integrase
MTLVWIGPASLIAIDLKMPKLPIKRTIKITEQVRAAALKLPLVPSVTKDTELAGFQMIVTTQRAFFAQRLQPRGRAPNGRRWPVVRHELADAETTNVAEGRAASLAAKAAIRQGRDPHRERLASAASSVAQRSIVPTTAGEVAALYAQTVSARTRLSDRTKRVTDHYVRKAIGLMKAETSPIAAIDTRAVRLMLDAIDGSDFERRHVFGAFNRFMDWCVKRQLIDANPCDGIGREDRPRPGRSREHTPPIGTLRRAWAAVENAPDHVRALIRFLLLVPLRREEAQGLLWSEVNLDEKRIDIRAVRTRARRPHSLPLSEPALAILADRAKANDRVFAPPSNAKTINWDYWVTHVRVALDEDNLERARRFNLHDVRRSLVSALAERGFDVDLLDQCLSHSRKGVFGVYQRSQRWREKETAIAAWAELIAPSSVRNNVVSIRAR